MSSNFKSQCEEDKWIHQNWNSLGLPEKGFFVEFGAADGIEYSNTYWLEKVKGWNGLLCEADPRHKIRGRENCIIERCYIGKSGKVNFRQHPTDPFLSGITRKGKIISLPKKPLSDILDNHKIQTVDFISIDTEGTELEAWSTLDLSRWRPKMAIFEFVTWKVGNWEKEITKQLDEDGYELVHKTWLNGIFLDRN